MTITAAHFAKVLKYGTMFKQGLECTVLLSACTVLFGFIIAMLLALMMLSNVYPLHFLAKTKCKSEKTQDLMIWLSKFNPLKFIASVYVQFVRCTPMLVQIFLVYYIVFGVVTLPKFTFMGFIQFERFLPGVVALSLNSGGYLSDVIRGGIEGVDIGQTEAARSLGMSKRMTLFSIVMPQAIKNVLPALANEVVTMVKESSICSVLGMAEIMYTAQTVSGNSYITLAPYVLAALVYFCINYPASKAIEAIERRMRRGDKQ